MDGLKSRSTVIRGRKGPCRETRIHLSSQWQPHLFQSEHFNTNAFPQSHRDLLFYSLDVQIAIHPVIFPFSHLYKALILQFRNSVTTVAELSLLDDSGSKSPSNISHPSLIH
jgi:hypothetical protein